MKSLLNKTFFHFVFGFLVVLIVSFTVILVTDFYSKGSDEDTHSVPAKADKILD